MLRLLLPTCLVVNSSEAWMTPILSPKPSTSATLSTQTLTRTGRSADKFGRKRLVMHANDANNDNQGSFLFDDEDCMDLCDLDDSDFDTTAFGTDTASPVPDARQKAKPNSPEKTHTRLTKEQQQLEGEKQKVRLEMHWEMEEMKEECDVQDASTCSDRCDECRGVGHTTCRFCMGAKLISLGDANVSCPVCDERGEQVCQKCRGSGRIAPWTELADFNPQL